MLSTPYLWWLMISRRPHILHLFLPTAYLVGGLCAVNSPVPIRLMSRRSLNDYQAKHPVLAKLERWLHRTLSAAVANSRAVRRQLIEEGIPAERTGLIYNGVEFVRPTTSRSSIRQRHGIGEETLVLTLVANLIPYKGHRDLFTALAGVRDRIPGDWLLLCVGRNDGTQAELEFYARQLGIHDHIRWLAERQDVPEILAMSDIGILCSHQEGFSNSLLEYMTSGLPVVATDVGGNGEAVVGGETGYLVPPCDPLALGEALALLATDRGLRARMGEAGQRRAHELFSFDDCVRRYVNLYTGLLVDARQPVQQLIDRTPIP
jgi:glycosyltransferase involved in cell wall biosynthesis